MQAETVVLHVDDDPAFADVVETFLERKEDCFRVETARSADEGLDLLETTDVDCIVSDYDMPGRDGLEFLEAVRARDEELPFVLFTGKGSEEIAARAITAGVSEYLQKASGIDQYAILANRIRNLVAKHRVERRVDRAFAAIDAVDDGVALFGIDGRVAHVNDAYADVYGYDPADLVDGTRDHLYPEDEIERYLETVEPALQEEGTWDGELVGLRADGSRFRSTHSLTQLEDGSSVCVIDRETVAEV